ncbi:TetR/AcrR family transcriptional regulator [Paenibacillus brevis]|uniref:TetR/AcrR family transcriptional regulator n=1 Tax=Paenibacillus brevis TaxID=2841508 RepID=A0ABS6FLK6_9BACL|nr:TetR/AcrR family transcriptional regulator [Paenibacillus brevis]MBU5671077.1 TetR/AcrR family transcriptional regulator [Paenibacillus brevis]
MTQEQKVKKMTNRDQQAAARKEQILNSARRLFAEKGYHATTMRELNKAIGMTEALTYHYFPGGKLEILRTVLRLAQEERIGNFKTFFENCFNQDQPLKTILALLLHGLSDKISLDREYFQILIRDRNLLDDEDKETLDALAGLPSQIMGKFLAQRYERGEVRKMNFEIAAFQFMSHAVVLIIQQLLDDRALGKEKIQETSDFYAELWGG